ncbi:MAG: FAD-binding oxidoreductase [Nitrospirae bacterium]|nr:FAD-binding oxidoreductase [Nitrospirota bacterium]
MNFESWGRFPKVAHIGELVPHTIRKVGEYLDSTEPPVLPRGLGRSYGDSCLNEGGYLLSTRHLNKFLGFNPDSGIVRCESGVSLDELLQVFVPKGWFLPVTPGTKYVTIGGAIANDIHGKNHHKAGTFCNHVVCFELERSDGSRILCSRDNNHDWFRATAGGLGLTGVLLWADIVLKPVHGPYIDMESIKFENLNEFSRISAESAEGFEYTVSWLDCLRDADKIRGIFMRGNHSEKTSEKDSDMLHSQPGFASFPFDAPSVLLSNPTIKLFNFLYYNKQRGKSLKSRVHYDPFFYPLDKVAHWNRMYGTRGFLQWQCVVPPADDNKAIKMILEKITENKLGSFLVVLKEFGDTEAQGMLSFPIAGTTLALDFPNTGQRLFDILDELDKLVIEFGGRIYPAKDARMAGSTFQKAFPLLDNFRKYIDPKFSSSFYRRVGRHDLLSGGD